MLTADALHGIYAGLPLPWTDALTLDEEQFRRTLERLVAYKPHGIYNGGSTGEFFAQDEAVFRRATDLLTQVCTSANVRTQVGIGALSTSQVIARGSYAIERGADALQVAFPFWYEVNDDEAVVFYASLHEAFRGHPLVHYDTGRSKHRLNGPLLERILEVAPSLIGVKFTGPDYKTLGALVRQFPGISFFTTPEWFVTLYRDMGVRGSYDPLVYMNPRLMLGMYEQCRLGDFEEAGRIQLLFQRFYELVAEVGLLQYTDAAIDRCIGLSTGFLDGYSLRIHPPYRSVSWKTVETLRQRVAEELPELLEF